MNPLFTEGDYLKVIPYNGKKIRIGDVIVFHSLEKNRQIVHRIVSLNPVIRTRGDNNAHIDLHPVLPENILGKVISVQKKDRTIAVYGGIYGLLTAFPRWTWLTWKRNLFCTLHLVYLFLSKSGVVRRMLSLWIKTDLYYIKDNDGTIKMIIRLGHRTIATYQPQKQCWSIRCPFRLIIDERYLSERTPEA